MSEQRTWSEEKRLATISKIATNAVVAILPVTPEAMRRLLFDMERIEYLAVMSDAFLDANPDKFKEVTP